MANQPPAVGKALTSNAAPRRSAAEEVANTATHAVGFVCSVCGALAIGRAGLFLPTGIAIACCVFATTLVLLYAVSTLSHVVQRSFLQDRLRAWDQGAVYLLIAGTYTPFISAGLSYPVRELTLILTWAAALIGFGAKVAFFHRVNSMNPTSYIVLGWAPSVPLVTAVSTPVLYWMAAGGVCYTVGTLFLRMDERGRYLHATWHLFVILGSACHFYAIYCYIVVANS